MKLNILTLSLTAVAFSLCFNSCIKVNGMLGEDFIPEIEKLNVYVSEEIPISDISLRLADSLSGISQKRITIGSTRDEVFGLCRRGCALTLVPVFDSVDFGKHPKFKNFKFMTSRDTTSMVDENQSDILQNIFVYELNEPLDSTYDINSSLSVNRSKRISKNIPVFDGKSDSLKFDFTKEFGEKYLNTLSSFDKSVWNDMTAYTKALPGIFIETDDPVGYGGRVNMFNLQLNFSFTSFAIGGNCALMEFSSEFDGVEKDTTCLFYFSPDKFYFADSLLYYTATNELPQYCLNVADHESRKHVGPAGESILVEGAGGLIPVITSTTLKQMMVDEISKHGNPDDAIINRATIVFPYEFPDNYKEMDTYPVILNPTARIKSEGGYYSFASLTETSVANRSMGAINRSLNEYSPDITYHAQCILSLDLKESEMSNYDVWFLIMASQVIEDETSASEDAQNDYYNTMMYANYYSNMYGYGGYGGYGYGGYGYGGYGGYGDYGYYDNYYNYMMYASMYGYGSTEQTEIVLDKDNYYRALLNGPAPSDKTKAVPSLKLIYSLPKK